MQNEMWRKGLVLGMIVLFVATSVTPSISGNIGETNNILFRERDRSAEDTFDIIVLSAIADSQVNEYQPNNNYGGNVELTVLSRTGMQYQSYIMFDLSSIPSDSTIDSATLELYIHGILQSPAGRTINCHRVTGSWTEYGITWNNKPSYHSTASNYDIVPSDPMGKWMDWDVTSDVEDFVGGTYTNYGWMFRDPNSQSSTGHGVVYTSKEWPTQDQRPKLTVEYTPPNSPPYTPYNPDPYDGETNVHVNHDLSWSGGDPDGDIVYYDVYFEAEDSTPDNLVSNDQTSTSYDPGTMDYNTHYYWKIEAEDEHGEPADPQGPIWDFTTGDEPIDPPSVQTNDALNIGDTFATLNGEIIEDGGESCQIRFRYKEQGAGSWEYPSDWHGSYISGQEFYEDISGLNPETTYEFQAGAKNSAGQDWGESKYFTTGSSQDPIADANGPYSGNVGEPITFDASSSYDPNGYIVGYRWDWTNDGSWDTGWLSDPVTTHVYNEEFHGQVKLEVKDNDDLTDTDTADVDISEPFYFVHISDIHYGENGYRQMFINQINWINLLSDPEMMGAKPAFILITGDLVHFGRGCEIFWCWLFDQLYEEENNDYSILKNDLENELDGDIEYYVVPGNHDGYVFTVSPPFPYDLTTYNSHFPDMICPKSISIPEFDLNLILLNSGSDSLIAQCIIPPRGTGLSGDDLTWLENHIDDNSLFKMILMHHPSIYYGDCYFPPWPCGDGCWDIGSIHNNRGQFMNFCDQHDVDLVTSGHNHGTGLGERAYYRYMDGDDYWKNGIQDFPAVTHETIYENSFSCRIIYANPINNQLEVCKPGYLPDFSQSKSPKYNIIPKFFLQTIDSPTSLHIYDINGNHSGINENGEVELENHNTTYSIWPINDTGHNYDQGYFMWNHSIVTASNVISSAEYTYVLNGEREGYLNLSFDKILKDNSQITCFYDNVLIYDTSIGKIFL